MKRSEHHGERRVKRHRKRLIGVQVVCLLALGTVALRIQYVQHTFGPQLLTQAGKAQQAQEVLMAQRGALLDRNGQRLAYDVPAYMLDIKTSAFPDLNQLAALMAPVVGASSSRVLQTLQNGNHHWVRWPSPILEPDKEKIVQGIGKSHAQDVTFTPTEKRFYPFGSFAANTVGYVSHDGTGASGLEAEYNSLLTGTNGEISYTRDIWGFPLQTTIQTIKAAIPGKDIELTIDETIQGFVEAQMDDLIKKYNPAHAAIIIADPDTGEILGMSSRPTYNPNQYWTASSDALSSNWAINDSFEPGSTFKPLTLAAGLATHSISLNETFMSGHTKVADRTIYDWKRSGWGQINYTQALEYSSNVGFATVAMKVGWDNMLHYMKAFGYLDKTGIDLPAEGNSIIFSANNRGKVELATTGFGQGIAVTPIQQVAALAAFANGGKLIQPHLAKAVLDPATGKVVRTIQPKVVNPQAAPPDVIDAVNKTLVLDVSNGIDDGAKIAGYDVAGKTGTANVAKNGVYQTGQYNVSFIGYAPGSHPKVEVYVTLNWPKTPIDQTWGSDIALPAARNLIAQCLQYYHVPPKDAAASVDKTTAAAATKYVQTPDLVGQSQAQASAVAKRLGLSVQMVGTGGTVQQQWPTAGIEVPVGAKIYICDATSQQHPVVPDLQGTSMREAANILAALGLHLVPHGFGYAASQSLAPGQAAQPGATITVDFEAPKQPGQ